MMEKSLLVGMYFISKEDGEDKWQGEILEQINDSVYLVQLYDWLLGMPSCMSLISVGNLVQKGCELYETIDELKDRRTYE